MIETKEISTEQRLENAIKARPERYIQVRDKSGVLQEVADCDTGRLWIRVEDGWIWID